jgi:NAD(P)-dependent dehydrogenase (short-subunit alcohol dehydrogenase family)
MTAAPYVKDLFDLTGRIAIVTGAGGGLGIALAEGLAEAGAHVVCADRNLEGAEATATRLEKTTGRSMLAHYVDVADEASMTGLIEATVSRFGRLDIMVNNAGIVLPGLPEDMPFADWQRTIDVDLGGVFLGTRAAAKAMLANPDGPAGSIINIASIVGFRGAQGGSAAAYAAAKGGVVNLTRDLGAYFGRQGVRVNAIAPGYFPSAMTRDILADPNVQAFVASRTPLGRPGDPAELKGPVVFLASRASSYLTGHTLPVDGGWLAW